MNVKANRKNFINKNRVLSSIEKLVRESNETSVTVTFTTERQTTRHIFNKNEEPIKRVLETHSLKDKRKRKHYDDTSVLLFDDTTGHSHIKKVKPNEGPNADPNAEIAAQNAESNLESVNPLIPSKIQVHKAVDPNLPIRLWSLNSVRDFHNMRCSVEGKWISNTFVKNLDVLDKSRNTRKLQEYVMGFNVTVRNYYQSRYGELISLENFCCIRNKRSRIFRSAQNREEFFDQFLTGGQMV